MRENQPKVESVTIQAGGYEVTVVGLSEAEYRHQQALARRALMPADIPGSKWEDRYGSLFLREDGVIVPREGDVTLGLIQPDGRVFWTLSLWGYCESTDALNQALHMATHRFDDRHDATIRPVDKIAPGHYRCEVIVGLTDGSLTDSRFVGEGRTAKQAESAALSQASEAIYAGKIRYRERPVPENRCPRCGGPLEQGKALFSVRQAIPDAMWEGEAKPATIQDCLKCHSCGYSETVSANQ